MTAGTNRLVEAMALAVATILLANGGQAACLAVLVYRVGDPVDAWVTADGLVRGVL